MNQWLILVGVICLVSGILLMPISAPFGIALIVIGIIILVIAWTMRDLGREEWRALSEIEPEIQERILQKARKIAGLRLIQNVTYPKVTSSHTRFVNVVGIDNDGGQVFVGIDPVSAEVVKMFKLCPRKMEEATEVKISQERAKSRCFDFLKSKDLTLPDTYILKEARVVSLGLRKRWRFVWRHLEKDVLVLPDFIMMEVNAAEGADIISYSKADHAILVDTTPRLTADDAEKKTKEFMKDIREYRLSEAVLSVVYPNNFFNKQVWEWADKQALCWILKFQRENKHIIDIWVNAVTGEIHGGELCHLPAPEVYGIDGPNDTHMQSHLNNIWAPYLNKMKYDVSSFDWTNATAGFAENTISNSIANSRFFIVEGHGDVTPTSEKMIIAYQGTDDVMEFTPDEVPINNLRFVLLDTCMSGHDGTGSDFKDTFISKGADVFIGFDAYMCAWSYEDRLLYYLCQGYHLDNAHDMAVSDVSPSYPITIALGTSCLNRIRLAPLLVDVAYSPAGSIGTGDTFVVTATVQNREDVDYTTATNVQARLVLPVGFSIVSGANPQNIGSVNWNSSKNATWTVRTPNTVGSNTLDVEIWSDNLGVAVDDPGDPYNKFVINVTGHFHAVIEHLFKKLIEIFKIRSENAYKKFYPEPSNDVFIPRRR